MCPPRQADFSLAKKREYRAQPYIVLPVAVGTWALVHRARNIPVFRKNHCWAFRGHLGILTRKCPSVPSVPNVYIGYIIRMILVT